MTRRLGVLLATLARYAARTAAFTLSEPLEPEPDLRGEMGETPPSLLDEAEEADGRGVSGLSVCTESITVLSV